jgi:hypothetical protein
MAVGDEMAEDQLAPLYTYKKPMELFETQEFVKICAPMVRYSK